MRKLDKTGQALLGITAILVAFGWIFAYEIRPVFELIIIVVGLCGLAITAIAYLRRAWPAVAIGVNYAALAVLLLMFGYQPGLLGILYMALAFPLTIYACVNWPEQVTDDRCRHCGYLLFNLPSNTCPECGNAFDPRQLSGTENV